MESIHANTLAIINNLIDTCKDSQHSFKNCAEIVNDEKYENLFEKIAREREVFIKDLQNESTKYEADEEPKENISKSFEGWKGLKSIVEHPDTQNILEICEKEEENAKYIFGNAMKQDIPGVTKSMITEMYNKIRNSHDEIREARNRFRES